MLLFSIILFLIAPLHVLCISCENGDDLFHWRRKGGFFDFSGVMNDCSFSNLGLLDSPDFQSQFASCLRRTLPYKLDCRLCMAELAHCTATKCINGCIFGEDNPECRECADTECNPGFLECGGPLMDPSGCPECTKPLGEIFFFLPDYVTVGLGLVIVGFIVCFCYRWTVKHENAVKDVYEEIEEQEMQKSKLSKTNQSSGLQYTPYVTSDYRNNSDGGDSRRPLDFHEMSESPQIFRSNKRVRRPSPTGLTVYSTESKNIAYQNMDNSDILEEPVAPAVLLNTVPVPANNKQNSSATRNRHSLTQSI